MGYVDDKNIDKLYTACHTIHTQLQCCSLWDPPDLRGLVWMVKWLMRRLLRSDVCVRRHTHTHTGGFYIYTSMFRLQAVTSPILDVCTFEKEQEHNTSCCSAHYTMKIIQTKQRKYIQRWCKTNTKPNACFTWFILWSNKKVFFVNELVVCYFSPCTSSRTNKFW